MLKKDELEDQKADCILRLDRAERLLDGLGGEKKRWTVSVKQLQSQKQTVVGDILLCSGIVAYLGAFSAAYRASCVSDWKDVLRNKTCIKVHTIVTYYLITFSFLNTEDYL